MVYTCGQLNQRKGSNSMCPFYLRLLIIMHLFNVVVLCIFAYRPRPNEIARSKNLCFANPLSNNSQLAIKNVGHYHSTL